MHRPSSLYCLMHSWTALLQNETWNVEKKDDNSPLTRADKEANAIICAGLESIGTFWRNNLLKSHTNIYSIHKALITCLQSMQLHTFPSYQKKIKWYHTAYEK